MCFGNFTLMVDKGIESQLKIEKTNSTTRHCAFTEKDATRVLLSHDARAKSEIESDLQMNIW